MVVLFDVGGVVWVCVVVKQLNDCDFVIIDKCRLKVNILQVMYIIGEVEGCICILVDDMVDIVGILCKVVEVLKENGVKKVVVYVIYVVLFGLVIDNLNNLKMDELVIIDIILFLEVGRLCKKICQFSLVLMLVECVCRINNEELLSVMFILKD